MSQRRYYEYRHVVGFEETNLVGNVYYVNHLRWQGRCREMFLREHCSELLTRLSADPGTDGLALVTVHCSCDYLAELSAFDQVIVRMRLGEIVQNRITMRFEVFRSGEGGEERVARGKQQVACMRREGQRMVAAPVPEALREALRPYAMA